MLRRWSARGAGDVLVFGGGIVPDDDAAALKTQGVAAIFTPGTSTRDIVDWIERELRPRVEAERAARSCPGSTKRGSGE